MNESRDRASEKKECLMCRAPLEEEIEAEFDDDVVGDTKMKGVKKNYSRNKDFQVQHSNLILDAILFSSDSWLPTSLLWHLIGDKFNLLLLPFRPRWSQFSLATITALKTKKMCIVLVT